MASKRILKPNGLIEQWFYKTSNNTVPLQFLLAFSNTDYILVACNKGGEVFSGELRSNRTTTTADIRSSSGYPTDVIIVGY